MLSAYCFLLVLALSVAITTSPLLVAERSVFVCALCLAPPSLVSPFPLRHLSDIGVHQHRPIEWSCGPCALTVHNFVRVHIHLPTMWCFSVTRVHSLHGFNSSLQQWPSGRVAFLLVAWLQSRCAQLLPLHRPAYPSHQPQNWLWHCCELGSAMGRVPWCFAFVWALFQRVSKLQSIQWMSCG
jgi:hypothetical protein